MVSKEIANAIDVPRLFRRTRMKLNISQLELAKFSVAIKRKFREWKAGNFQLENTFYYS